jgi:hypothetical protein
LSDLRALAGEVFDTIAGISATSRTQRTTQDPVEPIEFVARMAVGLGPRLIVIRNLERADEATKNAIRRLLHAMARHGWGNVRMLLEGRPGRAGDHWDELRRHIMDSIDDVVPFHVEPIDRDEFSNLLDRLFEAISADLKEVCWRRTAGYPLFLQNYLNFLKREGVIEQAGGQFRIVSPSTFAADVLLGTTPSADQVILGGRADSVLIARLAAIALPELGYRTPFHDAHFVLGLFGLAETRPRITALSRMFGLVDAEARLCQVLHGEEILDESTTDGILRFRHDLLREASIALARRRCEAAAIESLRAALPPGADLTDPVELELLGDLRAFAGQDDIAWAQYQRSLVIASQSERFIDVCRLAIKQRRLHERDKQRADTRFIQHIEVLVSQAWAEWNCGSARTARQTYVSVIESLGRGAQAGMDSSVLRAIASGARSRLVGINLSLLDTDEFIASVRVALTEYGDVAAFNSVLNRLVLSCGWYSLPAIGISLLGAATRHVAHRDDGIEREIDGEAVICADASRLFLQTAPASVRPLLDAELARSRRQRQRIHAGIDRLSADFLDSAELDLSAYDSLRDEAMQLGLYDFLTRLFRLRSAAALREGHIHEAAQYFDQARSRVSVQNPTGDDVGICNNGLMLALASHASEDAVQWAERLATHVRRALDARERLREAFLKDIGQLVIARSDTLARRYGTSPLELPLPGNQPVYSGIIAVAWLNLRRLTVHAPAELASIAREVGQLVPSAFDLRRADAAFEKAASRCGVQYLNTNLALCIE